MRGVGRLVAGTCMICLALFLPISVTWAQEAMPAAGGSASGSGGSVNYTIGQIVFHTHNGQGGLVAEGIQIPYEVSVVTSIGEFPGINLSVSAFPNPATDYLTLQINEFIHAGLSYYLFDIQGRLLISERISDSHTSIFMGDLVPAIYFVRVIQGNREVKTFKIVKSQ